MISRVIQHDQARFFLANISSSLHRSIVKSGLFNSNLLSKQIVHFQKPLALNFTSNKHLIQLRQLYSTGAALQQSASKTLEDDSLLANVAKRTLSCQPHLQSSGPESSHIPFEVKPKLSVKTEHEKSLKKILEPYLTLTKPNLTFLVMLSLICSYTMSPNSVGLQELVFLTAGTAMASGAANLINMGREPEYDRKMQRTSTRPVVVGKVSPNEAFLFAGITGTLGCSMLYYGVNPTVAALGFVNLVLYSWVYTSLKRKSILNTWVGAIVGAIPPLMGWAASSSLAHPGAWCLALLLYAWQFPHFNSLSHNIRNDYKNAGYVMTAFENPKLNARVALRYSLMMFPLCYGLSYFDVTDQYFIFDSSLLTAWISYWAYKFWAQQRLNYKKGSSGSKEGMLLLNIYAKKLFWASVWYLPGVLVLGMLHKKGQWDRFFNKEERLQ